MIRAIYKRNHLPFSFRFCFALVKLFLRRGLCRLRQKKKADRKAGQPTVSPPASGWRKQVSPMCVVSQFCRRLKYLGLSFTEAAQKKSGLVGLGLTGSGSAKVVAIGEEGGGGGTKS